MSILVYSEKNYTLQWKRLTTSMNTENLIFQKITENFIAFNEKCQQICTINSENNSWHNIQKYYDLLIEDYQKVIKHIHFDSEKMFTIYSEYLDNYSALLKNNLHYEDKRFKDELWHEHPLYHFISQSYLLLEKTIEQGWQAIEEIAPSHKEKVMFYTKQWLDFMAPSNFLFSNPHVLQQTIETQGDNLVRGLNNFFEDISGCPGKISLKMTDFEAFEIGKNIATTKGKIIFQNSLMQLIQYEPTTSKVYRKPLLIVPPWINKYYILDLSPQNSLVRWLVEQGYTVFMISWVNPNHTHADKNFEHYLSEGTLSALEVIQQTTGISSINAMGYCIGGTLLASTLAYLAAKKKTCIASATYLTTLLDFANPGSLGVFLDEKQFKFIKKYVKQQGFLDGFTLSQAFNLLRANDLIWSNFVKNYLHGDKPIPMDILYWNADYTNLPQKMLIFYLRHMYLDNKLIQSGEIRLLNTPIHLKKIKTPTYFLSAEQDHIAPWKSTYSGRLHHGGKTTFVLSGSGHIAGVINPPIKDKYYYYTNETYYPEAEEFLNNAQKNNGSWWTHWENWLSSHSGKKIAARMINNAPYSIIEDAPGSYVRVSKNIAFSK